MGLLTIVFIAIEAELGLCMMAAPVNVRGDWKQFLQALFSICSYKVSQHFDIVVWWIQMFDLFCLLSLTDNVISKMVKFFYFQIVVLLLILNPAHGSML